MNSKLSRITSLFLLVVLSIAASCSGDDNVVSNPGTKKPKKITTSGSWSGNYFYNYEYSGQKLTKMTGDTGEIFVFQYDSNNKLHQFTSTYGNYSENTSATYTAGNLTQLYTTASAGGSNTKKFFYNQNNQVIKSEEFHNSSLYETVLYQYDTAGNVSKITIDGQVNNIAYDGKNHPFKNVTTQVEDPMIGNPWYGNLLNNPTSKSGYTFTYEYDGDNFPTKRVWRNSNGVIVQTDTYQYY
jgi:hypothetical protein